MKKIEALIGIFLIIIVVFACMWTMRMFSNATTSIVEHNMANGDTCYLAVTSDGAAMSCLRKQ